MTASTLIKDGIKSLAVVFRDQTKVLLWSLLGMMAVLMIACGTTAELTAVFYVLAVGGSSSALALMISNEQLKQSASCWWWFGKGFWWADFAISGGLLAELVPIKR